MSGSEHNSISNTDVNNRLATLAHTDLMNVSNKRLIEQRVVGTQGGSGFLLERYRQLGAVEPA